MHLRAKKSTTKYSYVLTKDAAYTVRFIGVLGLLSMLPMLYGYYQFVSQSLSTVIIFGVFYAIASINLAFVFFLMAAYPIFNLALHKQRVEKFNQAKKVPRVAVFIPVAGEPIAMVEKTVAASQNMTYKNFAVFILDDSANAQYKSLATKLGVGYLRRRNIGFEKKAGNINAALKKISGYQYTLILDADFIPRPEMISELIPYAEKNVAIVQSPQHFDTTKKAYRRSKIEHGAAIMQQTFYRILQPSRDRFGAAMCVGTNALYSISALKKVGGFEGVGDPRHAQAEDVHTGLKLMNTQLKDGSHYKIKYVPIQLAQGLCPDNHHSLYKQQNRWATGSMQLILTRKTLFSSQLSLMQRLIYAAGPLYYIETIGTLLLPVTLLYILLHGASFSGQNMLLFIPTMLITSFLMPYILRQRISPISSSIVLISNTYTYLQALLLIVINRPLGWEASGVKAKKKSHHFAVFNITSALFFVGLYLITFLALLLNDINNIAGGFVLIAMFAFSFFAHMLYFGYVLLHELHLKTLPLQRNFYAYVSVVLIVALVGFNGLTYKNNFDVALSKSSLIGVVPKAEKPAQKQEQPAAIKKADVYVFRPISVTAETNDSNWSLATKAVHKIRGQYTMPNGQAGKLHDRLLQNVSYNDNLAVGQTYTYTHEQILDMLNLAYVYPHEQAFWDSYAYTAGVAY